MDDVNRSCDYRFYDFGILINLYAICDSNKKITYMLNGLWNAMQNA